MKIEVSETKGSKALCLYFTRFEFPLELDVYKYTVDGLAEREQAEAAAASEAAGAADAAGPPGSAGGEGEGAAQSGDAASLQPPHDPQQYQYSLKGIVVHSGSAFAGHYYSYIKVLSLLPLRSFSLCLGRRSQDESGQHVCAMCIPILMVY